MPIPKSPILTVDGIILAKDKVLLLKRALRPFFGFWALPGGHVDYGETVEKAIKREIKEELGIPVKIKGLFGVYSNPKRDPRYHTISIVYLIGKIKGRIRINKESSEFKYFSLRNLPRKIGFDHRQILNDFKRKL
jgi:8-oxo-dGTP diphosphatase